MILKVIEKLVLSLKSLVVATYDILRVLGQLGKTLENSGALGLHHVTCFGRNIVNIQFVALKNKKKIHIYLYYLEITNIRYENNKQFVLLSGD